MSRLYLDAKRQFRFCLAMHRALSSALLALLACGCSRTAPDTQWPGPGPANLPYIPFPEDEDDFGDLEEPEAASPASAKGPAPIDAKLPAPPKVTLARDAKCAKKKCELKGFLPDAALAKGTPTGAPSPAALWTHSVAKGSTMILPRHHELECFALVLEGNLLFSGDDGGGAQNLGPWGAARAPGCGVILKARDGDAKAVLAVVTTKDDLDTSLARAKAKPWEVRWKKRPSPLFSFVFDKVDDHAWAGGAFHARIALGGAKTPLPASFGLLRASSNASVPLHDHKTWEHLAVLSGSGKMKLAGAEHAVRPGSVFHIPKGQKHSFSASGKQPLLALQLYTPSGAEQRFVKLAKDAKAATKAKAP